MQAFQDMLSGLRPRAFTPYLIAIGLFALMSVLYVSPVLEGRQLLQSDIVKWQGMAQEIVEHREQTGEEALWTNSMFGGMPAFQVSVRWANNIAGFFHDVMTLWLPRPADMIFLYFAGFFIFLLLLKVNPLIALAGAVAFALSSYHFVIIEAGHNSKAVAIGYMAPVLGAAIYTFRGQLSGGGLLFAIFMGLQVYANHFQITYYLGFIVVFYGLFQLAEHIREKQLTRYFKKMGVLIAGLIIAIGINIGNFWGTYSYTSETMRGGTELTIRDQPLTSGLDKDYITAWSYGIEESFSLLIPNAKGGQTGQLGLNQEALERVDPAYRSLVAQENQYWGNQPFTSGSVYVGAVVLFFFFLSLFYVKGPVKWGFLLAIVLSVALSWGRNFMPLTDFFIDYVPGYDKFRAVSMTLVIAGLCIPALAFLGLCKLYEKPEKLSFNSNAFTLAFGLTAGFSMLFYLFPSTFFSFTSRLESQAFAEFAAGEPAMAAQINEFVYNLEQARIYIFRSDALRSFFFATAAAIITLLFTHSKISKPLFVVLLVLLVTFDMWPVNRRYLNNENFVPARRIERPFSMRTADQHILQDDAQFRVLDFTENTFNSSRTSYYHHSIGGYHGAKLQRYQDLIDFHIKDEMMVIEHILHQSESEEEAAYRLDTVNVLNMLNPRYIIYHPDAAPLRNPYAAGNAWFVDNVILAENADEEIMALEHIDPLNTAVVDKRFSKNFDSHDFGGDPSATIDLVHYAPNHLQYDYRSSAKQLVIFSEIFYPDGWEITINGEKASHFRANYILRAMVLPAGDYSIDFRFRPRAYYTGQYVALAFSIILVTGIIAYALIQARRIMSKRRNNTG